MKKDMRRKVQEKYGKIADSSGSCCCATPSAEELSAGVGYSQAELDSIPAGANLGLGCGNPVALASLRPGETVLDLGAGGGIDCFLAAKQVGPDGKVIGVDMTAEMIHLARENARQSGLENVEFRLGEIENLPLADGSVDVAISNCVINLSPDKQRVFGEVFRVLKSGGRMMVSDIVLDGELPEQVKKSVAAYTGCIGGAMKRQEYLEAIARAGFTDVKVIAETGIPVDLWANFPAPKEEASLSRADMETALRAIASVKVAARKPNES